MKDLAELLLVFALVSAMVWIATGTSPHCQTVTLHNLDPRFVESAKIAAASRNETLEQWMVESSARLSGYHLNDGFCK